MAQMTENKMKALKRIASMSDSMFYALDELMGMMQVSNDNCGYDVLPEDKEAFTEIKLFHDIVDEYRWRIKYLSNKLK